MNTFLNLLIEKGARPHYRRAAMSLNEAITERGAHEQYQVTSLPNYHADQIKRRRKDSGRYNHNFFYCNLTNCLPQYIASTNIRIRLTLYPTL